MKTPEMINYCLVCGAPMEPRHAFGKLRPACTECSYIHFEDPKVAAAVLIEQDREVLLVRRANKPRQGMWTLPAGFVDGEEDPKATAERECMEETGLSVRITELLDVISGKEHDHGASIVILYRGEVEAGTLQPGDDADEVAYFPANDLPPLAFRATRRALELWQKTRGTPTAKNKGGIGEG
jgi:ADP-ribose pyrophosphatase YjhB (NUDIX family)